MIGNEAKSITVYFMGKRRCRTLETICPNDVIKNGHFSFNINPNLVFFRETGNWQADIIMESKWCAKKESGASNT